LRTELNDPVLPFTLTADTKGEPERLAQEIRTYLGINDVEQQQWKRRAFDGWRQAIGAKDVLVFIVPRLPIAEMRGAAIAERELPIILINGRDRTNGRVFTLLHEFCHLAICQSGVSGTGGEEEGAPNPAIERVCNAVAAAALMPREWLLSEPLVVHKGATKTWDDDELEALALRFGVSREALLRRLLTLGKPARVFTKASALPFSKNMPSWPRRKAQAVPNTRSKCLANSGVHSRGSSFRDIMRDG
jgi:Zn-dependent peptidase ImmA (M78 family)